jgi:hypothetical protein
MNEATAPDEQVILRRSTNVYFMDASFQCLAERVASSRRIMSDQLYVPVLDTCSRGEALPIGSQVRARVFDLPYSSLKAITHYTPAHRCGAAAEAADEVLHSRGIIYPLMRCSETLFR